MIPTTLGSLLAAGAALQRLSLAPLPMKPAYHLSKLQKLVGVEVDLFAAQHRALVARFGEDRPATEAEAARGMGPPFVKPEHLAEFQAEVTELLAVPVTIAWPPFDLAWLPATCEVTAADLIALGLHAPDGALVVWADAP